MQPSQPYHNAETFQENVTPVQGFESKAVPITPEMIQRPRRGRPERRTAETEQSSPQSANRNSDSQEHKDSAPETKP
jgi:hypothetical protein